MIAVTTPPITTILNPHILGRCQRSGLPTRRGTGRSMCVRITRPGRRSRIHGVSDEEEYRRQLENLGLSVDDREFLVAVRCQYQEELAAQDRRDAKPATDDPAT